MDTGRNTQEEMATLLLQQERLLSGYRPAQMFPTGTIELPLPKGMQRVVTERGVFHYNPYKITRETLLRLSSQQRENELLELGPYSKLDILNRLLAGETLMTVSEYDKSGVEVRTAVGTNKTIAEQEQYFEKTKQEGSVVFCGGFPARVQNRLKELGLV